MCGTGHLGPLLSSFWDLLFSLDAEFSRCLVFVADVFCEEPLFVDELEEFIVEFPFGVGTFN